MHLEQDRFSYLHVENKTMAAITDPYSGEQKFKKGRGRMGDVHMKAFRTYDEARTDRQSIRYMEGLKRHPNQREILNVLQEDK
jgi:hypothetical protein